MIAFYILGALAGAVWILYQCCASKTSDKTEAAAQTLTMCVAVAACFLIPYGIVQLMSSLDTSWTGIIIICVLMAIICYLAFRSDYLEKKRQIDGSYHEIRQLVNKKLPTYEELVQFRADHFRKYDEYISDERAVRIWRDKKYEELRNERIDQDNDIFGWKHKI